MCDCIDRINKGFVENGINAELDVPFVFGNQQSRPLIKVVKRDEKIRIKPPSLFPSYCPFCGEKYSKEG